MESLIPVRPRASIARTEVGNHDLVFMVDPDGLTKGSQGDGFILCALYTAESHGGACLGPPRFFRSVSSIWKVPTAHPVQWQVLLSAKCTTFEMDLTQMREFEQSYAETALL